MVIQYVVWEAERCVTVLMWTYSWLIGSIALGHWGIGRWGGGGFLLCNCFSVACSRKGSQYILLATPWGYFHLLRWGRGFERQSIQGMSGGGHDLTLREGGDGNCEVCKDNNKENILWDAVQRLHDQLPLIHNIEMQDVTMIAFINHFHYNKWSSCLPCMLSMSRRFIAEFFAVSSFLSDKVEIADMRLKWLSTVRLQTTPWSSRGGIHGTQTRRRRNVQGYI